MKKKILFIFCALTALLLITFNQAAGDAAREAYMLWQNGVLPALLPYFICADILQNTGVLHPENPAALLALSLVSGAPTGARLCASLPDERRTAYSAVLNTTSPMYIISVFGARQFKNAAIAIPILIAQFSVCCLFFLFLRKKAKRAAAPLQSLHNTDKFPGTFPLLAGALSRGIGAMMGILGALIFFSTLISLLNSLLLALHIHITGIENILLNGFLEMVTGTTLLATGGYNAATTAGLGAFMFSFCGICILGQSSLFSEINPWQYLKIKLLQGGAAGIIAYVIGLVYFKGQSQAAFGQAELSKALNNAASGAVMLGASLVGCATIFIISALYQKKCELR